MNRAERRSNNKRVIRNRLKELKEVDKAGYEYLCTRNKKGSLSKQNPFNCGQSCPLCNPGKFSDVDNKGYKKKQSNTYKGDITDE